ncbi:MAG TPA: hypothetical protein VGA98_01390 [Allosphingosinicella sp.]|jgi:hypothetical protein
MRLGALFVTIVGLMTFVAAQGASGGPAIVLATVSLTLFFMEIVFGLREARASRSDD